MKKLGQLLAVFTVLLYGANYQSGYSEYVQQSKDISYQNLYDKLQVVFNDVYEVEYANDQLDAVSLVRQYENGAISFSQDEIDLSKLGYQEVEYTLTAQDDYGQQVSRTFNKTVKVILPLFLI